MRMQPPTDEQRARNADLTAKVQASVAAFEALPDIDKAVHCLDQKRSGIHGLSDFDSPLTKEQRDAIIDHLPESVVLKAYRDARAEIARLTAERDALLAARAGVSEAMVEALRYRLALTERRYNRGNSIKAASRCGYTTDDCVGGYKGWCWDCPENPEIKKLSQLEAAALATPIPTPVDREAIHAEAEKSQGPSNLTAPSASIDRSAQETAPQATHAVISMNDLFGPGWSNGYVAGRAEAFEEAAKIVDREETDAREVRKGALTREAKNRWDGVAIGCHYASKAIRSAAKTEASR